MQRGIPRRRIQRAHPLRPASTRTAVTLSAGLALALAGWMTPTHAQVNHVGQRPYLGWSTFSEQTLSSGFLTQASMQQQSDALARSGLQAHGFDYLNMDSGWMGSFDGYGRPIPNPDTFPDIKALIDHIHANGQKAGIYWIPGVEEPAVTANDPILGTSYHIKDILAVPYRAGNAFGGSGTSPYHYKIDFSKPGAQAYIDSVVALFASWGVDFIKLDGVTPGSYSDNLDIDNRGDVEAWSKAIAKSGRPIWLTVSWQVDKDYLDTWQHWSNARRIDDDVECEGRCSTMTNWPRIYKRFRDLPGWQDAAGPAKGWNDLDSLDVMNGQRDGLDHAERRSAVTLWAMANAPLSLGGDLTRLDAFGKQLLGNDAVIAVDQTGKPAQQLVGGRQPVWVTDLGHGEYYVALFNLNDVPARASLPWSYLGARGARHVQDLWTRYRQQASVGTYSTMLPGHGVQLLKLHAFGHQPPLPSTSYEAEQATLAGNAQVVDCSGCSGGGKVGNLGLGTGNTVTFEHVDVPHSGVYLMQVDSMTLGLRSYLYTVNGGRMHTLDSGGGSFNLPSSRSIPVCLHKGVNRIQFDNPASYPPDLDRIVIRGDGRGALPTTSVYEAEQASLAGTASAGFSNYASGLAQVNNVGGGADNTVTFTHVNVPAPGRYLLEIDYATDGQRQLDVAVNGGPVRHLSLDGSSFDNPATKVIGVYLNRGDNRIRMGNATDPAPNLDAIVIAPSRVAARLGASTRSCPSDRGDISS